MRISKGERERAVLAGMYLGAGISSAVLLIATLTHIPWYGFVPPVLLFPYGYFLLKRSRKSKSDKVTEEPKRTNDDGACSTR